MYTPSGEEYYPFGMLDLRIDIVQHNTPRSMLRREEYWFPRQIT